MMEKYLVVDVGLSLFISTFFISDLNKVIQVCRYLKLRRSASKLDSEFQE